MVDEADDEVTYDIDEDSGFGVYTSKSRSDAEPDPFAEDAEWAKSLSGLSANKKRSISRKTNELKKKYEGREKSGTKRIEDDIITGYNAFEVVLPPYNLDYLAKLYEKSSPHYAAVNAKVSNIVGLGYDLIESPLTKRRLDEKAEDQDWVDKHRKKLARLKIELMEYLDSLNKEDTFAETLTKVWKDYEATGNGYIEVSRMANGKIGYVGHVPSTTIRVRRKRDGFVQIISNKAVFFRNFGEDDPNPIGDDKNPNELIHIKKYSPSSTYYGVPDIIAAQQAVAGNEFSARFNLDYFENKAVPRHVIVLKGATINPKLAANLLEFFETGLKGRHHRSLFIPLPAASKENPVEFDFKPVEAGVQDSSFNNYRKANLQEILMAHRVPITKVGMAEGVALAVARDADKTFKEQVCQPEQRTLEKKLNRIFSEFTDLFKLKLNEMTLTDADTQSKIDERQIKTGQRTPNEVRTRDGLPAHPDGDELVDLNIQAKKLANENRAEGNRERDSERSAGATDSAGEGRNPKGEGRSTR